eukprot:12912660-Prorocentrum_lima.AAC.1
MGTTCCKYKTATCCSAWVLERHGTERDCKGNRRHFAICTIYRDCQAWQTMTAPRRSRIF